MIVYAANLAAAVALLLWSVRLIRTGVERAYLPEMKRRLQSLSRRRVSAAGGGLVAAMLLQSSTAVALIGSGFAVSGMLAPHSALALLLGAELGSALMAQVLILPVQAVIPFVLLGGVVTFFSARSRKAKQTGRILIGFALVFVSLGMVRAAAAPVGSQDFVRAVATYFEGDLVSAFVLGALLAWLMHSSLAAVLTFAAFGTGGLVAAPVAAAMVIGANLGGAVVPVILLMSAPRPARMVAVGNLLARAAVTLAFLAFLATGARELPLPGADAGQQVIALHILLNAILLVVGLPLAGRLVAAAAVIVRVDQEPTDRPVSALDRNALDRPRLALACAQRELLRMSETVHAMLADVMTLFRGWDDAVAARIERREDDVDRMHYETKIYLSHLRENALDEPQSREAVELVAMANSIEEAADRISVNLLGLARKMRDEALVFSDEGRDDLEQFHDQIVSNTQLALTVLTTGDAEAARQLVAEKDRIRREEQRLQERHLVRLQQGTSASVATTNIHQETLRVLKQINAAISFVAYPIAEQTGDLLGSRLAEPTIAGPGG